MQAPTLSHSRIADKYVLRCSHKLKDELTELALINNRSCNSEVLTGIEAWLEGQEVTEALRDIYARQLSESDLSKVKPCVVDEPRGEYQFVIRYKEGMRDGVAKKATVSSQVALLNALKWWVEISTEIHQLRTMIKSEVLQQDD